MNFTPEWEQRLNIWMNELANYLYQPIGEIPLEGFVTIEQLTPEQAALRSFAPCPAGTAWGRMWEYGWFRGQITLPPSAAGKRIVLRLNTGGEALVWLNGRAAGARDREHTEILLSKRAEGGETFHLLIESYAGHGPRLENGVPCPPGTITVPLPEGEQVQAGLSTFGVWNEDAYQLWMDWRTLWLLRKKLNPHSLRWQKIDRALRNASLAADFERETEEERNASFREARACLAEALACRNGSTAPVMYMFGQSHLDLAWLWPWQETRRKSARTTANQLALLEEYPSYRFLWCEPPLYLALKEGYPELYERVREKLAQGRIFADGAVWVECDTNLPNGESLIRQIMYGRRFYQEELGTDSRTVWLPDCFGFSAALPQIMRGCGVRWFATQKIIRNYNGGDPFPYNIFQWEGIDGTRILTHIFKKNNALLDPETVVTRWEEDRNQTEDIDTFLFPFGYGDGGGGPVRDHVEFMTRMEDLEGMPRMRVSTLEEFFRHIGAQGAGSRYVGELYFQCHRGTYTSQAAIKKGNRSCEFALREADFWLAWAGLDQGAAMERLWKTLLFNQFHDILPGASIRRVCQEAQADHKAVLQESALLARQAQEHLTGGDGMTLWNSLSWPRKVQVPLPEGCSAAEDEAGNRLPCQMVRGTAVTEVDLPSCGFRTIRPLAGNASEPPEIPDSLPFILENDCVRVRLDEEGRLISVLDRETGSELLSAPGNEFRLYRDVPVRYEAWDIDHTYAEMPVPLTGETRLSWAAKGPLRQTIRMEKRFSHSVLTQDITLRRGRRQVEFSTTVDWHEHHKLLKAAFPTAIQTTEALHEIQFGYVKRPTHRSRQYDKDRFESVSHKYTALCEEGRGAAVLSDCKYGVSAEEGAIALTLLRSPKIPDMEADMGRHQFTYAFTFWNGSFLDSPVVREAYELNAPLPVTSGGGSLSFLEVSAPNVVLDTVKRAEDGSGDLILRLYECKRAAAPCDILVGDAWAEAEETNLIEEAKAPLSIKSGRLHLRFRPFEIKTVRLKKHRL